MKIYKSATRRDIHSSDNEPTNYNPFGKLRQRHNTVSRLILSTSESYVTPSIEQRIQSQQSAGLPYHRHAQTAPLTIAAENDTSIPTEHYKPVVLHHETGHDPSAVNETRVSVSGPTVVQDSMSGETVTLGTSKEQAKVSEATAASTVSAYVARQWRRLRRQATDLKPGDVEKETARVGRIIIQDGPISTTGKTLLKNPARRKRVLVIEYSKMREPVNREMGKASADSSHAGPSATPNTLIGGHLHFHHLWGSPTTFSSSSQSTEAEGPHPKSKQINVEDIALTVKLKEYLRAEKAHRWEGNENLRIIYIQDDLSILQTLTSAFFINFPHERTNFGEWCRRRPTDDLDHLATWQTSFWRPMYDRSRGLIQTASGLEYLVPKRPTTFIDEAYGRAHLGSNIATTDTKPITAPVTAPDSCIQKLSVYVQLKKPYIESTTQTIPTAQLSGFPSEFVLENTVMVYDSMYSGVSTDELMPAKKHWQHLLNDFEPNEPPSGHAVALAALHQVFEAVAGKWSDYILSMSNYIAGLEEEIYGQPASDRRAPELWSISKQLLQAERLIKFHVYLLMNVQNELTVSIESTFGPDWLAQTISEYKRLGSEVEERLKKPTAHMVDLMYKSISIRDARQSLKLNTSLWRLSWITFIFLPLTFLAGVFGMNVSVFKDNPPLKWYFIVAVPLMVIVMASWLLARKWMRKDLN